MDLFVDIGNTAIKWAHGENDSSFISSGKSIHKSKVMERVLDVSWENIEPPENVWIANVAGEKKISPVIEWVSKHWKSAIKIAQTQQEYGEHLLNGYEQFEQLGVDRWLALVAISQTTNKTFCVVSCGTAITIDVVREGYEHLGGLITPGLQLMNKSLTSQLLKVDDKSLISQPESLLGRNTKTAIDAGCLYATTAFVDRIADELAAIWGTDLGLYLTGGDGELIASLLEHQFHYEANLVLKGLQAYAKTNS